jgi:myosin heavy chain 6/7
VAKGECSSRESRSSLICFSSLHEIEKARKRAELEKEGIQLALEEAESALEQEEAKVLRAQMELGTIRQEIDRRSHAKEEEFETTRPNHARAVESMQASLEAETRAKAEALKQVIDRSTSSLHRFCPLQKKKLESALDHSNRSNTDFQKSIKRIQQTVTELQAQVESEQRQRDEAREIAASAERRANLIVGELEELRTGLEQAERARKAAESELHEAADRISELNTHNANLSSQRRQLESNVTAMQSDLDEAVSELKNVRRKPVSFVSLVLSTPVADLLEADTARLAGELRREQDQRCPSPSCFDRASALLPSDIQHFIYRERLE